ncbi:MAG: hypothetical protein IAB19_04890 [Proteobacteria bacterium]|uniref:Uncharacterized protein n=1 Tax=Candidatus Avisuccinivibrio stercorigallinarum TaxID=2840704 RepID=A0A9D9DE15_9GAMM|nr:hypothetical protein [Candidatus Avisuccinivibrio stercorigallinarum]
MDKLGRLDVEALYSKCAQRPLQTAQACSGIADREKLQVIFFASGALSLFEDSEEGLNSEPRLFNFNALLDGQSKIPLDICFAELFGQEALETVSSKGAKASKLVTEQRRAALISMLERQHLSGSVLELPKALDSKEVQAAAQSAGVAVVQRKAGSAALVHKPSSWSLWELISVHYIYCTAEFLENQARERAVCFILALSLMLWYFLDAKVRAACAKLQITDLKAEFFKKTSAKVKGSAADKKRSAGMKVFHSLVTLSDPSVMEVPQGSTTALKVDGLPPAATAIVNELGPCYQRYLTAKACSGKKC